MEAEGQEPSRDLKSDGIGKELRQRAGKEPRSKEPRSKELLEKFGCGTLQHEARASRAAVVQRLTAVQRQRESQAQVTSESQARVASRGCTMASCEARRGEESPSRRGDWWWHETPAGD